MRVMGDLDTLLSIIAISKQRTCRILKVPFCRTVQYGSKMELLLQVEMDYKDLDGL